MGSDKSTTGLVDVYGWICGLFTQLSNDKSPRLELPILRLGKKLALHANSVRKRKEVSIVVFLEGGDRGKPVSLGKLGKCRIEDCSEEKMQKKLFPLLSRLFFYAFFGIIHKDIVNLQIYGSKNNISEEEIEKLYLLGIKPGTIETPVYKQAFNILIHAACDSHLIHLQGKSKESTAKLKQVAAEVLKEIGPAATELVMKSLASKYTQIFLEYKGRSVDEFKISYSSSHKRHWTIHCYCPRLVMQRKDESNKKMQTKLKYALSHQLLQCMFRLDCDVKILDDCIKVELKIDNLRCKSLKLDSYVSIPKELEKERYFPAKITLTIEPERKSEVQYVSLGMSSQNPCVSVSTAKSNERRLQLGQSINISLHPKLELKTALKFTRSVTTTNTKMIPNWRFQQNEPEGGQGSLDWTLFETSCEKEVIKCLPKNTDSYEACKALAKRGGPVGPFTEDGGIVFARDPYGEKPITWRFKRNLKGQTLVWFVECKIWLAYFPNEYPDKIMEIAYQKFRQPVKLKLV